MIPYGRQSISQQDLAAVEAVLRSDYLTQGPAVPAFEEKLAGLCGASHAIAVNSATSALHIAYLALGVGPGDRVWTTPITFVASANAALYCGAEVDFVDIDPGSYNMCARALAEKLEQAAAAGTLPKLIVPVHLAGQSCDMAEIRALADRYGARVVEDASHAVGGHYRGEPVGNCRYSDICIFSFHPVKIVTTGEGGMALTNDAALAQRMALLRSHGITRDADALQRPDEGGWYYEQQELGFNYRLTDVAAALGSSQLDRLEQFIADRVRIADRYDSMLAGLPLRTPRRSADAASAWHLYVIRLNLAASTRSHREVFEDLRGAGIGVNLHYIPVYKQPYYRDLGFAEDYCPEAEAYYREAISLPMFPALTAQQQDEVVAAVRSAVTG